ncbi:hypothetical protein RclHR1_00140035 [Rhizophagus clarus]|uniref:Uncharacterized protein n=1 Tax=Rhizophagus clarus TaxID=94130 RepID=A0A2Z6QS30_9GLOM|nr:hypothetical protein RclHR1_00140035 [Rhizophagus clarus]
MAGIATRYVTENEFNTEMSIKELRYNFSEEQVFALISELTASQKKGEALLNAPDTPNITQEAEIDTDNLSKVEVKVIVKALAESATNANASLLYIFRLQREL